MVYAQLIDEDDGIRKLVRRKLELDKLKKYPSGERAFTGTARILMALMLGGSNVVTLVLLGTSLSHVVSIGFFAGAVVYAIKAARDVYKKRKREKELTEQLNQKLLELEKLFDQDFIEQLNALMELSKDHFLNEERSELVYTHLLELKNVYDSVMPDPKQTNYYLNIINDSISKLEPRIRTFRQLSPQEICEPRTDQGVVAFSKYVENVKPFSAVRYVKKFGNRLLSFMAGSSSAVGIGFGIASIAFGITSPTGLAFLAIIGAAAMVGLMAVAIDYHLSRRQDKKTLELDHKCRELDVLRKGVSSVKSALKRMKENVFQSLDHERKEAEAEQKRRDLLAQNERDKAAIAELNNALETERERTQTLEDEISRLKEREIVYLPPGTVFRGRTEVVMPGGSRRRAKIRPQAPGLNDEAKNHSP